MKYEIHFHVEFIMRSDRDWVKSSPTPLVNRYGQITLDEEAVQSEDDAIRRLGELYENNSEGELVSLEGIEPADVMMKTLIVDKITQL